jgi:chromate transporter
VTRDVSFAEALRTWARIGLLSFGGPVGQIALMHRVLVEEKRWISEQRFLHALNYCMLLPGPEAQQLATYIGWLLHGTRGGLVAGSLFVLPGFVALMTFSIVYVTWSRHPLIEGVFLGLKAAVVALVVQALVRIGSRALQSGAARWLAVAAFIAIATLHVSFPLIILAAALLGYLRTKQGRNEFMSAPNAQASHADATPPPLSDDAALSLAKPSAGRSVRILAIGLPLWLGPVAALALIAGPGNVFTQIGVFFSKMAVVTFGGAYAVLSYVAQQAVEHHGWLSATQMLDGLGLAESTPGPLIMVVQFVAFLAAYQAPGVPAPLSAGILAACLSVWVTFVPCFLWIFLGAPYIESLRRNQALSGALAAITAAVVGVIANLALWFALHTLFADVRSVGFLGPVSVDVPLLSSVNWIAVILTGLSLAITFVLKWNLAGNLAISTGLGVAVTLLR